LDGGDKSPSISLVIAQSINIDMVFTRRSIDFEINGLSYIDTDIGGKALYGKIACA
jgi:hypothetical protein